MCFTYFSWQQNSVTLDKHVFVQIEYLYKKVCLNIFHKKLVFWIFVVVYIYIYSFICLLLLHDKTTTIPVGIYDKFTQALTNAVQNLKVGDGFSEGVVQVISLHMLLMCSCTIYAFQFVIIIRFESYLNKCDFTWISLSCTNHSECAYPDSPLCYLCFWASLLSD